MTRTEQVETILKFAAEVFELGDYDLRKPVPRQHPVIHWARQLAMYWMRVRVGMTCMEVAMIFGLRDHSTVLNASKRTTHRLKGNAAFADAVQMKESKFTGELQTVKEQRPFHKFTFPVTGLV